MNANGKPKVLVLFFSFTGSTGRVADVMSDTLTARGCDVTKAKIEFTDPKYSKIFHAFPMKLPALRIPTLLIPQRRRKTGEIGIPPEAESGDYDLVVIGSPTWWLTVNMPIRSYLKSPAAKNVLAGKSFAAYSTSRRYWKGNMTEVHEMGEAAGGTWLGETHFTSLGNQVTSMMSWLAFMRRGKPAKRSFLIPMPAPNLKPDFEDQAKTFVDDVLMKAIRQEVSSEA